MRALLRWRPEQLTNGAVLLPGDLCSAVDERQVCAHHLLGEILVVQKLKGERLGPGEPVHDGRLEVLGELDLEVLVRVRGGLALHGLVLDQILGDAVEVEPVRLCELEPEPLVEILNDVRQRRRFGFVAAAGPVVDSDDGASLGYGRDGALEGLLELEVRELDLRAQVEARPGVALDQ